MDTRTKIISASEAMARLAENQELYVVRADLDPLYAPHVAALQGLGRPLLLLLGSKESEYLNLRARAEMAASLGCIRYVVTEDASFAIDLDLRGQEAAWRSQLEATVLAKSATPEKGAS